MSTQVLSTFELKEGEKAVKIMAYTANAMVWGDVITREAVRVSTWLRTQSSPDYFSYLNAQVLMVNSGALHTQSFSELHLPVNLIEAYHLMPPAQDPLDYDPQEPNRKMEPVSILLGSFRFDGTVRMSSITNLARYLDVNKEVYTSLYDVEVSQPGNTRVGVIRVPFLLIRRERAIFSPRISQ